MFRGSNGKVLLAFSVFWLVVLGVVRLAQGSVQSGLPLLIIAVLAGIAPALSSRRSGPPPGSGVALANGLLIWLLLLAITILLGYRAVSFLVTGEHRSTFKGLLALLGCAGSVVVLGWFTPGVARGWRIWRGA